MAVTRRQTRMASSRPTKRPKTASTSVAASAKPASSTNVLSNRPDGDPGHGGDTVAGNILRAEKQMSDSLENLSFSSPVTHVYNPHVYAWDLHEWYVKTYGDSRREILLVGMNPGPWGMAQTGVPFGQVDTVKDWLKMPADIAQLIRSPDKVHEKRPIDGLDCKRSEVSGRRLWKEFAEEKYKTPESFFSSSEQGFFVHQYCPLMFLESTGRNRTPVQIRASERKPLLEICDQALLQVIQAVQPKIIGGIGAFAADRCKIVVEQAGIDARVGKLLHPSPASPAANKGWVEKFSAQLDQLLAGESQTN